MMGQNATGPGGADAAYEALEQWWDEAGVSLPPAPPGAPARPWGAGGEAQTQQRVQPAALPKAAARPAPALFTDTAPAAPDDARRAAAACATIAELRAAVEAFEGCALKRTAKNTVFSRGALKSGIMVVGEAPGFEEDARGAPFVGRSGVLLDKMFAAIGVDREDIYVSNILFWRPPGNRNPSEDDIRACLPFVERHIALAEPKILVLAGKLAAQTLLRAGDGIMRLRGRWSEYRLRDSSGDAVGRAVPTLPVLHPAFLLRQPGWKAQTWRDFLSLQERLEKVGGDSA